ncbi:SDR family NAD(P)-dependent oxidoreductase [Dactylosporangium sucinum]|uniref:Uncharacterized protein n=1 Tax=Dactylosporangium sucinum TaxID=1424081 RepID=A0A917WY81_9ACTN|nr:SDR family NAD(P)-dependent oxidoreductase [Dactylosporangium sucinum]GGM41112.1 hypothetical protein GCM10007977_048180 [Dactylosporangium sucinum]
MQLAQKVVVVTGAGSGIGRAVALAAVRRGAHVAAVDLNPATLAEDRGAGPGRRAGPALPAQPQTCRRPHR